MNILKKLFGRNQSSTPIPPNAQEPRENADEDPRRVIAFDEYGRELRVTRQQWREQVLPGALEKYWNNADKLAGFIVHALQDQFIDEMVKPAERLFQLEEGGERSTIVLANVHLKQGLLDDCEAVLRAYGDRKGESGYIMFNLAKVAAARGDNQKTLATLWHALELEPNQANGVEWYEALCREHGGDTAGAEALRRIAGLPGSWRAHLGLARAELHAQRPDLALGLYRECLARAGKPAPMDLLMVISGELGKAGHLAAMFELVEPVFEPAVHGLGVGNNLIHAHIALGQLPAATKIIEQLYAQNRPDWRDILSSLDNKIAEARVAFENAVPAADDKIKLGLLVDTGPVWLTKESPASRLFPAKPEDSPVVSFLGSTAEGANIPDHVEKQLTDAGGRMSRALPLFLAEQAEFRSGARAQTLVPWVIEPSGSFMLGVAPWGDAEAVNLARSGELDSEYLVVTHLDTRSDQWIVTLRLIRAYDSQCIGSLSETFSVTGQAPAVHRLADGLLELLAAKADIATHAAPENYTLTGSPHFPAYLVRLEQLLAVRCSTTDNVGASFLNNERQMIEGNLDQCLDAPASVNTRLLLAQTVHAMKRARPDILAEFAGRIELLQKNHALPEPAHGVVKGILDEALAP